jgi:hypothetical protein
VPRPHARLALARLEHEQQRVEPGDDLPEGHAQQRGGGLGALAEEVVELVGVRLDKESSVSLGPKKGGWEGNIPSNHTAHARSCTTPSSKSCTRRQSPARPCTCC